jgi:cell division protein FtsA
MMGRRLDANFHIVIGKTSSAKHIEKCVNRVGLNVADLVLEPLASAEAVLTDDEREAGVALIDIGGGTTDLAIYYEGNIRHTAVIPFGGNVNPRILRRLLHSSEAGRPTQGNLRNSPSDIAPITKLLPFRASAGGSLRKYRLKTSQVSSGPLEEILDFVFTNN